ncbi:MAG: hypothetical protein HYU53_13585 [Acidobacteria bacterium]|nr:hypothetical protein [Acidobacteriota bacterium]
MSEGLTAGCARICISPRPGTPLAGFGARQGVSRGAHDELYVRALVLERDGVALALAAADLLALQAAFVDRVRAAIERRIGLAGDAILIAATHTHAAPLTFTTFVDASERPDPAYMQSLAQAVEDCVALAWENRGPAAAGVGSGRISGFGVNRRTSDGTPVDEEIGLITVAGASGRARAVLVNYACHPTVLGPDNLLATADFPAFTIERLERALAPDGFAMFVNGAQGNVGPGHSSEKSAIGIIEGGRTFERARELGERLAEASLGALAGIPARGDLELGFATARVDLPLKRYPSSDATAAAWRAAEARLAALETAGVALEDTSGARTARMYAAIHDFYAREAEALGGKRLPITLQALRIGDAMIVAVPAEAFVELGLTIKRRAGRPTLVAGIANGYIGYLPTREAHAAGGYEVVASKCGEGAGDVLVEAALDLERRLFGCR